MLERIKTVINYSPNIQRDRRRPKGFFIVYIIGKLCSFTIVDKKATVARHHNTVSTFSRYRLELKTERGAQTLAQNDSRFFTLREH